MTPLESVSARLIFADIAAESKKSRPKNIGQKNIVRKKVETGRQEDRERKISLSPFSLSPFLLVPLSTLPLFSYSGGCQRTAAIEGGKGQRECAHVAAVKRGDVANSQRPCAVPVLSVEGR